MEKDTIDPNDIPPKMLPAIVPPDDEEDLDYDPSDLPKITLTYADVLTRPLFYPHDAFSKALTKLMRRKTFTRNEIALLRNIGFVVEVKVRNVFLPKNCR